RAEEVARLVVGSLLLLPALVSTGCVVWLPAVRTLALSVQSVAPGRAGEFVGLANYARLLRSPGLPAAAACTLLVALARAAAVLALPALVGRLGAAADAQGRLVLRLGLTLGLALSAPAAVGLLWRVAVRQMPQLRWLADGAASQPLLSYLALEFVACLGVGGCLAATALLVTRPPWGRAARGVLALAAMAAAASGLNAFSLPFAATGGGPLGQTTTLALRAFRLTFQVLRPGQAAAEAVLLLVASLVLGVAFGAVGERLRLEPAREHGGQRSRLALPGGALAGGLLVLPLVALYLWGAGEALLLGDDAVGRAASTLVSGPALVNGLLVAVPPIVLVQLPASYLAALSLALVRPFGRRGSRLAYLGLLSSGFVPPVVTGIGLFDVMRGARLENTLPGASLPLVAGAASLFIFRLHFAGREEVLEAARRAGKQGTELLRLAVRGSAGVAALAGAASLLLAGQSLEWPLLALGRTELLPLSLQLMVQQSRLAELGLLPAGAWLVLSTWGLPTLLLWWLLQALVLQEVEVAAG
ncbi:MAG: hypothetical protein QME94_05150, partial [Anaerolineae bacterium]|nr:hypothetical protein [Anaerolineae bacterium]